MSIVKNRKTIYGHLPPKNISELKPWYSVHVDLIGPYSKSIKQQHPGCTVLFRNSSLTYMKMIDPATGWFKIFKIPMFDLKEVALGNDEYIDKSSARVSELFNNTWLCRYLSPHKVVFDNRSDFKRDFTPLLKYFDIKPVLASVNKPQSNATVDLVHQLILNMVATKDLDNKVFDYIDPWGETLASIAWTIRASNHRNIMSAPVQAVFGRDMLFNLASFVD